MVLKKVLQSLFFRSFKKNYADIIRKFPVIIPVIFIDLILKSASISGTFPWLVSFYNQEKQSKFPVSSQINRDCP